MIEEVADWHELEPQLLKAGIIVPKLRAIVDVGSFIRVLNEDKQAPELYSIARLMNYREDHNEEGAKKVNLNLFISELPPVSQRTSYKKTENSMSRFMPEVWQTQSTQWYPLDAIVDICFVFLQQEIENLQYVEVQGRKDSYATRTRCDGSPYPSTFVAFPCMSNLFPLAQSLSRSIWNETNGLRLGIRKLLSSTRQDQGQFCQARGWVPMSLHTWMYVKRSMPLAEATCGQTTKVRIDNELMPGLMAVAKRTRLECEVVSLTGDIGVSQLVALLGQHAIFGRRQRRPRICDPLQSVVRHDVIHALAAHHDSPCVRFEYTSSGQLFIVVKYVPYFACFHSNGQPRDCPSARLVAALMRQEPWPGNTQTEGAEFEKDLKICRITSISENHVTCTIHDGVKETEMTCEEVEQMIMAYIE